MTKIYLFPVSRLRVTGPTISAPIFANSTPEVTGCNCVFKNLPAVDRAAYRATFGPFNNVSSHHGSREPLLISIDCLI